MVIAASSRIYFIARRDGQRGYREIGADGRLGDGVGRDCSDTRRSVTETWRLAPFQTPSFLLD